jgi:hypothetical protein
MDASRPDDAIRTSLIRSLRPVAEVQTKNFPNSRGGLDGHFQGAEKIGTVHDMRFVFASR